MLVWLLELLLLTCLIYVVYRIVYTPKKKKLNDDSQHYTFKI